MTTNSPNPVDGDVQAHQMPELTHQQREHLLCFINDAFKSLSGVEPESTKKYDENLGELTKQVFQVSLAALTTPPAHLLRPVELPDCVEELHGVGPVMAADAVVQALRQQGYEVKS